MRFSYFLPLLLAPLLYFVPWKSEAPEADPWLATAQVRTFSIEVEAPGELQAARSTSITSSVPGDLGKVIYLIDDGSAVSEGDLLVRLDPSPYERWIAELEAKLVEQRGAIARAEGQLKWETQQAALEAQAVRLELRTAEMELERVRDGEAPVETERLATAVAQAESRVDDLDGYLIQLRGLSEQGYLSPGELAQCERERQETLEALATAHTAHDTYVTYTLPMALQRAETALERAKLRHQEGERSAQHKVAAARSTLHQARESVAALETQLAGASDQLKLTEIRAPTDGMVVLARAYRNGQRRQTQLGDILVKNQPLIELPDLSQMVVTCRVREVDLHQLRGGMTGKVRIDAFPALLLDAHVVSIGVLAKSDANGEKSFEVRLALEQHDSRLRPGMSAHATLHSAMVEEALTVPLHALFEQEGATFCYRALEEGYQRVPVTTGPCNARWATILSGLAEGDAVYLTLAPDAA